MRPHRPLRPAVATSLAAVFLLASAALWSLPESALATEPDVGDEAPAFTLSDQDGEAVSLASFRGKSHVLIAFYPRDFTGGCTREMTALRKEHDAVSRQDIVLLGVSGDSSESHARFAKTLGLPFRLLADTGLEVARRYGVFTPTPKGGYAARSVFLVDREGRLRFVDRSFAVPTSLAGTELGKAIELLGEADPLKRIALLPSPAREGQTLLVDYVRCTLARDARQLERLLHPRFGTRATEQPAERTEAANSEQAARRKRALELHEKRFAALDPTELAVTDCLDWPTLRAWRRDELTPSRRAALRPGTRKLADAMEEADLLVLGRTRDVRVKSERLFDEEIAFLARKDADAWRIYRMDVE